MTLERNNLTKAQTMTVAAIEERLPDLVEARDVVESFHDMLRRKSSDNLEAWIERAAKSLVASFASGVIRDRAAIQNAITSQWSNCQTEGQITKLKLIKRQMYGRGKLDLLEARIVGVPCRHRDCVRAPFRCRLTHRDQDLFDDAARLPMINVTQSAVHACP